MGLCLAFAACTSTRRATGPLASEERPADVSNEELANAGAAADASAQDAAGEESQATRPWMRGTSQTRLVQRWSDGDDDLDLYEVLSFELGDERSDRWTGHASARLAWDADGDAGSPFFSLADSEGDEVDVQLYDAYAETRDRGAVERLRIGRQFVYDTPIGLWFDGAWAQTKPRGADAWSTGLYGGVPVHAYESSSRGDWLVGLFEEVRPSDTLRLRADYMYVEDDTDTGDFSNDLIGLGVFHDGGERLRWDVRYSALDGESRDVVLGASWLDYERDLTLRATFTRLLEKQKALALELDPFFDTLLTLFPYDELRLSAGKGFGEHAQLLAGADVRRLRDESDVGAYNHDFERVFATVTFERALPGELTLALTGERWNSEASDIDTWGADLSRRWGKRFDAALGSFYSLFKFDPLNGSEREDVRTYYALVRWRATEARTFQVRYEHEDQDLSEFDSLRWGMTWRF